MSFMPSLQSFVKGTAASVVGLSSLGIGLLYYGQNYLIYPGALIPPGSREEVVTPDMYHLPYEDLRLDTLDHIKIHCYFMKQRKRSHSGALLPPSMTDDQYAGSRPTVIMFHGNGGNMGHRIPLARIFYNRFECNVMMVSYRGYGLSEGTPSEKGIRIDAQTVLDYLISHPIITNSPQYRDGHIPNIIIYGQSIGGAVSLDLASRNPHAIRAIILENTFLSIPRLIPHVMPYLSSVSFLCHQRWDNAVAITKIPPTTALLMLSGTRDEVVPSWHMEELWKIAETSGRKNAKWLDFRGGTHNDTILQRGYWEAIGDFILRLDNPTLELEVKENPAV